MGETYFLGSIVVYLYKFGSLSNREHVEGTGGAVKHDVSNNTLLGAWLDTEFMGVYRSGALFISIHRSRTD